MFNRRLDRIVSIGTKLQAGRSGVKNLAGTKTLYFRQHVQTGSGSHSAYYSMGTGTFAESLKRPRSQLDHSSPSSTEVKNEWS
jgi:hypothetical protein